MITRIIIVIILYQSSNKQSLSEPGVEYGSMKSMWLWPSFTLDSGPFMSFIMFSISGALGVLRTIEGSGGFSPALLKCLRAPCDVTVVMTQCAPNALITYLVNKWTFPLSRSCVTSHQQLEGNTDPQTPDDDLTSCCSLNHVLCHCCDSISLVEYLEMS